MNHQAILIIGQVWPEPTSSAAGWRMIQLIKLFIQRSYEVHFACTALKTEFSHDLSTLGVKESTIKLNDASFDDFVQGVQPAIVLFDRFMIEEQFGWRVAFKCPNAIRILDTEDLHFLRNARQEAFKNKKNWDNSLLFTDTAKREIAAILRCDISLIISKVELRILQEQFRLPKEILFYLPFVEQSSVEDPLDRKLTFENRNHFVFIGNFLHEPNWRTVQLLKTVYWPLIKDKIPHAQIHIYGAYSSQKVQQLHNPKEGFLIKGRAIDARETLMQYRVLLAPIPFGAGIKGKFIDAMTTGTPSVTTEIGAEGISDDIWSGFISNETETIVNSAVNLYQNKEVWQTAQDKATSILEIFIANEEYCANLFQCISHIQQQLDIHRNNNFFGQILHTEMHQAKKYMSLWIEEKNRER